MRKYKLFGHTKVALGPNDLLQPILLAAMHGVHVSSRFPGVNIEPVTSLLSGLSSWTQQGELEGGRNCFRQ